MVVRIEPLRVPIQGYVALPFSKSISARQILLGAYHEQPFVIKGLSEAQDTQDLLTLLRQLGYSIEQAEDGWHFRPCSAKHPSQLHAGEGGTTLRFILPWLAFLPGSFRLALSPRLARRPLEPLIHSLKQAGADVSVMGLFIEIRGNPDWYPDAFLIDASQSGQFLSGLLLAAPRLPLNCFIRTTGETLATRSYIEMTQRLLQTYGYVWESTPEGWCLVRKPSTPTSLAFEGEADWSSGGYFWAWALLHEAELTLPLSCSSLQPESRFWPELVPSLCLYESASCEVRIAHKAGALPRRWCGDITNVPDTFPTLAVLGALAAEPWQIQGIATLPHKESNRLQAMAQELAKAGAILHWEADTCTIIPASRLQVPASFDTHGDHRVAMALSLFAATAQKPIHIRDAQVVTKSFPFYWQALQKLGVGVSIFRD